MTARPDAEVPDFQAQPATFQQVEGALLQRLGEQPVGDPLQDQVLEPARNLRRQRQQASGDAEEQALAVQHSPASSARTIPGRPCQ